MCHLDDRPRQAITDYLSVPDLLPLALPNYLNGRQSVAEADTDTACSCPGLGPSAPGCALVCTKRATGTLQAV